MCVATARVDAARILLAAGNKARCGVEIAVVRAGRRYPYAAQVGLFEAADVGARSVCARNGLLVLVAAAVPPHNRSGFGDAAEKDGSKEGEGCWELHVGVAVLALC